MILTIFQQDTNLEIFWGDSKASKVPHTNV